MKHRSAALDAVRVIGVTAVVAGHAIPDEGFREVLFAWHVPVFFFLSGYLWNRRRGLRDEWLSRSRSLAKPYLFWLAVIGVPYVIVLLSSGGGDWIGPLLGGANANEPFTTFWFVSVLFFSALLFRMVSLGHPVLKWVVAGVGLLAGYLVGPLLAHSPLAIGSALPCLAFVVLGQAMRPAIERVRGKAVVGIPLVVIGEALVALGAVRSPDIKFGDYGTPVLAFIVAIGICAGLILVAEAVFGRMPRAVGRVTTGLAYASFTVVLVHPVVQWAVRPFEVDLPLLLILMLVLPWALGLALRHTHLAPWTTGSPFERRRAAA
ncbi:MAG: acyltransferase 3 [Microbacteriaceae bacterium]|nr:acyltransferase 3 [Microbacteriaceae bacterium]HEV7957819.1 acyltransferase family protein [Marisediminicola sp.]